MKLAEALVEKKHTAARIQELEARYIAAAVIEEGNTPDEAAGDILVTLQAAFDRWQDLTVAINKTNNQIVIEANGVSATMMELLAHRDSLKTQIAHYTTILASIRQRNQQRSYYNEGAKTKMIAAEGVDVAYFITLVDVLSKEFRLLDVVIQGANWSNELLTLT